MSLLHQVYDTDAHFKIDPITRAIKNSSTGKNVLIQYDHNSERFTFELPRFIDGHDMSKSTAVEVHYINIDSTDKTKNKSGVYPVTDLQISPDSEDVVICSWLISQNATQYAGTLNFLLKFKCTDTAGTAVYRWHTAIFSGISVSSGMDNGEAAIVQYSDVLEQWRQSLVEAAGNTVNSVLFTEQNLTEPQQEQARKNIKAISAGNLEEVAPTENLLKDVKWHLGYYFANGVLDTAPENCAYYTGYCDAVPVNPGDKVIVRYTIPANRAAENWFALNQFGANGEWVSRNRDVLTTYEVIGNKAVFAAEYTIPDGVFELSVTARSFARTRTQPHAGASDADVKILADMVFVGTDGALGDYLLPEASVNDEGKVPVVVGGKWTAKPIYANPNIKAINHRGHSGIAPENTLSAFRLSKKKGFDYVECDVKFTSDKVAVLLHDSAVDRTSNGTGNIQNLTFAEVRALDFGSWKSPEYAGEKIPSFEEFVQLCKRIGLHPYFHIESNVTAGDCASLVSIVKRNGMHKMVTWVSYNAPLLQGIKEADEYARLGLVQDVVDENGISKALALKGENNEVFITCAGNATQAEVNLCFANDIPLEVGGVSTVSEIAEVDPYVTAITTDELRADAAWYDFFG